MFCFSDVTTELSASESSLTDDEKAKVDDESKDVTCQPPLQTADQDSAKAMGDHDTGKCVPANTTVDAMQGDVANVQDKSPDDLHHLRVPEKSKADLALKASIHVQCDPEGQIPNQAEQDADVNIEDIQPIIESKFAESQEAGNAEKTQLGDAVPTEDGKTVPAVKTEGSKLVETGNDY